MGIKYAISVAIEAKEALDLIDSFGRDKFNEKYPREKRNGPVWYLKTKVINDHTLEVFYGYGDDFEDSFKIDLYGQESN
jgi:hypothetical protein